jgi:hypothetical protein
MKNEDKTVKQTALGGGNIKQAGRDITEKNGNQNFFIGIFFVVILAFGGLAWALTVGINHGGQTPQTEHKSKTS